MFSAPSSRALVCGATIESCHDHSDTTRTPVRRDFGAVELGEPRVARPQLRERGPRKEPRVDAAVVRRAERHHRRDLCSAVPAQVRPATMPPMLWPTIATRDAPVAARIASIFAAT